MKFFLSASTCCPLVVIYSLSLSVMLWSHERERESLLSGWWSAHSNTNTGLAAAAAWMLACDWSILVTWPECWPLIGQSAASWALIGWAAASLWSSIIGRREEKLSSLTWETVNNICYSFEINWLLCFKVLLIKCDWGFLSFGSDSSSRNPSVPIIVLSSQSSSICI